MPTLEARVKKVRGDFIVALPEDLVTTLGIREGDRVDLFVRRRSKDFFGALRGIGSLKRADHADHS